MENHDKFNQQTVTVLSHLYREFPNQPNIDTSQSGEAAVLSNTIEFWRSAGLVTIGQTAEAFGGHPYFFFVGLTLQGLTVLRSPWRDSANAVTIGERMVELDLMSNSVSVNDINQVISELLKYVAT